MEAILTHISLFAENNGEDKGRVHLTKRKSFAMKIAVRRKSVDFKVVRVQFPLPPYIHNKYFVIKNIFDYKKIIDLSLLFYVSQI
jgi:hypothetical protein